MNMKQLLATLILATFIPSFVNAKEVVAHTCESLLVLLKDCNADKNCILETLESKNVSSELIFGLGELHFRKTDTLYDPKKAFYFFDLAAKKDHALAVHMLGEMYLYGLGGQKDKNKAIEYFEETEKRKHPIAMTRLGYEYLNGYELEQNSQKAANLIRQAAILGNSDAQRLMGYLYYSANGVERNYVESYAWYTISADQGDKWAKDQLGDFVVLLDDDEVPLAEKKSQEYYKLYVEPYK